MSANECGVSPKFALKRMHRRLRELVIECVQLEVMSLKLFLTSETFLGELE